MYPARGEVSFSLMNPHIEVLNTTGLGLEMDILVEEFSALGCFLGESGTCFGRIMYGLVVWFCVLMDVFVDSWE